MGDYGFLVKNNAANKSVFPVRIHPQLQHTVHHQTTPPSPPAFISNNNTTNGGSVGSAWLFPAVTPHSNMQDDILESEMSKAPQLQQESQEGQDKQTLSPPGHQEPPGIISELDNALPEENQLEKGTMENANGKETLRLESPGH